MNIQLLGALIQLIPHIPNQNTQNYVHMEVQTILTQLQLQQQLQNTNPNNHYPQQSNLQSSNPLPNFNLLNEIAQNPENPPPSLNGNHISASIRESSPKITPSPIQSQPPVPKENTDTQLNNCSFKGFDLAR